MTYESWRISYQSSEQAARSAYKECAQLRARIEAMEKQEPVGEVVHNGESAGLYDILEQGALVYSLPGAQPAPSVPDLLESLRCACNYIDKLGSVSQQYRAMLASPEAKQ